MPTVPNGDAVLKNSNRYNMMYECQKATNLPASSVDLDKQLREDITLEN